MMMIKKLNFFFRAILTVLLCASLSFIEIPKGYAIEQNEGKHFIIYHDAYQEQAERLQDICIARGIDTEIRSVSELIFRDNDGNLLVVGTPDGEDVDYTDYWASIIEFGADTNAPVVIMYGMNESTFDSSSKMYEGSYLTLFGNPLEIPPSTITGSETANNSWFDLITTTGTGGFTNGAQVGNPTDYFYSLKQTGGGPESLIPDLAVGRLPVTIEDTAEQVHTLNIDTSAASYSIIQGDISFGATVTAGELIDRSLYLDVDQGGLKPFYQTIIGNTPTLADGSVKILATSYNNNSHSMNDVDDFPYIVNTGSVGTRLGGYALFDLSDNVQEAFEVLIPGSTSVLLDRPNSYSILDGEIEVSGVAGQIISIKTGDPDTTEGVLDLDATEQSDLSDGIDDNSLSIVLATATGVYAVSAFDDTASTFEIVNGVGDNVPTNLNGSTVQLYDMTEFRDYLRTIDLGITARYIEPSFFIDADDDTGDFLVQSTGYIYDLQTSATGLVDKIEAWDTYIDSFSAGGANDTGGKVDYFQNALLISSVLDNRWEFFSETDILEKLNFRDITDNRNISLFNGFNITKAFESNNNENGGLRLISDNFGDAGFPTTSNPVTGELLSNGGVTFTGLTDEYGRFEISFTAPSTLSSYSLVGEFFYLDEENVAQNENILNLQVSERVSEDFTVQAAPDDAFQLVFSDTPPIITNSGTLQTTIEVSLVDQNYQRVQSNAEVSVALTGSANFVDGGSVEGTFITENLSNGVLSLIVELEGAGSGETSLGLAVGSDDALLDGVFGSTSRIFVFENVDDTENVMTRVRVTKSEPVDSFGDTVNFAFQAADVNRNPVSGVRRVTFKLTPGKSLDVINSMNNKGIVYGADAWVTDVFRQPLSFFGSDFAENNGTDPTIPLAISSGGRGMYLDYDRRSVEINGGYGQAAVTTVSKTGATNYTGFIGYIGGTGFGIVGFQRGEWDKGEYLTKSEENNRQMIAFETLNQYSNSSAPVLGDIYLNGIDSFLQAKIDEDPDDAITNKEEAATELLTFLQVWGLCGVSGLPLPSHVQYPDENGIADEVPEPSITLMSDDLRQDPSFDRFESYLVEVPLSDDNSNTSTVTISVDNYDEMLEYDADILFRYTLVSVPLNQPVVDPNQYPARISELDFVSNIDKTEIYMSTVSSSNTIDFEFGEHWVGDSNGNVSTRGPALYMVKVESQEKERTGTGVTESQKAAQFTKEKRVFFRVVNEFVVDDNAQFLILNNTDQDPYRQDNRARANRAPNSAIRYYEDALDNYMYNKGTISVNVTSNGLTSLELTADDVEDMHWESRVVMGDKVRFRLIDSTSLTPWLRVTDVASDGSTLTVENTDSAVGSGNVGSEVTYMIQRAYTTGYASIPYTTATQNDILTPTVSNSVTLSVGENTVNGFETAVQVGDFFKFLDERAFVKITGITSNGVTDGREEFTLTLSEDYPFFNVHHYYSNNELYGGHTKLDLSEASSAYTGSYAIYPPSPSDSDKPLFLYQTWNVHNYVTSNFTGTGLHGDIKESVLEEFNEGDSEGIRHKAVIWANDAAYGELQNNAEYFRNRDEDDQPETNIFEGTETHYVSEQEEVLVSGFLGRGGRLFMSGQKLHHAATSDSTFFTERIGALAGNSLIDAASLVHLSSDGVEKIDSDPISNSFEDEVSITSGLSEGAQDTIEEETTRTNVTPFNLEIQDGRSIEMLKYTTLDADENELYAGVRTSGGDNIAPYASVFLGFDFSNVRYSGVPTLSSGDESDKKGRNLLMKKSLDWLRDPSLTSDDRALRIIYEAEDFDGSKTSILLPKKPLVTINSDLHSGANLSTSVGVNQELGLIAQNGLLYGRTQYTWTLLTASNGAELVQDTTEPDNDDWHKVVFKTGSQAGTSYQIQLEAPDQSITSILVETEDAPLFLTLNQNTSDNSIQDGKMIYDSQATVEFFAFGGSGLGSYVFFARDGGVQFANDDFLTVGQRTVTYNVPDSVSDLDDEVVVSIEVQSGSQIATSSITLLPPVEITNQEDNFIVRNGAERTLFAFGGSSSDYIGTTSNANITATTIENSNGVSLAILDSFELSTNPNSPTVVDVVISDSIYDSSDNLSVNVYEQPIIQHGEITGDDSVYVASTSVFETVTDGKKVFIPTDGIIPLHLIGGTGAYTFVVESVESGISSANIVTFESIDYSVGESFNLTYTGNSQISLNAGDSSGTVTLSVETEGGSTTTLNLDLVFPIDVKVDGENFNTSTTLNISPSSNVSLSASNSVGGPYTWSFTPSNIGGGFGSTVTSSGNSETITSNENEEIFFFSGTTEVAGVITVEDANGNLGEISVNVTTVTQLAWRSDSDQLSSSLVLNQNDTQTYRFEGGVAEYTVSVSDSMASVSKDASQLNSSTEITLTSSDAKTDNNGTYYEFYFFPTTAGSGVVITVSDSASLTSTLISGEITINKSLENTNVNIPIDVDGGGGGGGCLLSH